MTFMQAWALHLAPLVVHLPRPLMTFASYLAVLAPLLPHIPALFMLLAPQLVVCSALFLSLMAPLVPVGRPRTGETAAS
jgi:hypothetical protein